MHQTVKREREEESEQVKESEEESEGGRLGYEKADDNNINNNNKMTAATTPTTGGNCCAGCGALIRDKFIFSVIDLQWHQECVQCADCTIKLDEKCYTFEGKLYCKLDYWRRFGPKCYACSETIGRSELVQRIKGNRVYHLKCFTCDFCQKQLMAGEQLHLIDNQRLLCKQDYHEFSSKSSSVSSKSSCQAVGASECHRQQAAYYTLIGCEHQSVEPVAKGNCAGVTVPEVTDTRQQHLTLSDGDEVEEDEELEEDEEEEEDEEDEDEAIGDEEDEDCGGDDDCREEGARGRLAGYDNDNNNLENEENHSLSSGFGRDPMNEADCKQSLKRHQHRLQQQQQQQVRKNAKRKRRRKQKLLLEASNTTNGRPRELKRLGNRNGESILGAASILAAQAGSRPASQTGGAMQPNGQHVTGKPVGSPNGNTVLSGHHNNLSAGHKPTRVRTVLNEKQLQTLRDCYAQNPRPDALMKEQLVDMTGLSPRVIRVWFQNKRCKDKKKSILYKQMQQQEKDGRELVSLMRGVSMVAASPIQYTDDQSTLSSAGPPTTLLGGGPNSATQEPLGQAQQRARPTAAQQQQQVGQQQQLEIQAYQPPWASLVDYARLQQQQQPASERLNASSPRYQQLMSQIHGYTNEPRPSQAGEVVNHQNSSVLELQPVQQQQSNANQQQLTGNQFAHTNHQLQPSYQNGRQLNSPSLGNQAIGQLSHLVAATTANHHLHQFQPH